MKSNHYPKFALMLALSFIIMYAIMFLNVDDASHIYLSLMRLYMTLLMISAMAILMLLMMRHMYTNARLNAMIIISSLVVFALSLTFARNQTFIGDEQYMRGMIPHHSIAILTSKHAHIKDPEVKKLSQNIIKAQEKEITEMKMMLQRLEKNK